MAKILIKNGRVWDGERFLEADLLTDGEKIVEMAPKLSDAEAYLFDAAGKTVTPGLVDEHAHLRVLPTDVYGMQTEMSCFPFGVTAAADAGRIGGSREILDSFMVKNVVFVSAALSHDHAVLSETEKALERFGDKTVGVKVYFDTTQADITSINGLAEVCAFARESSLKVMVHCNGSPVPMREILETLRAGDILTHAFHGGKNNAAEDGFESMRAAQRRGVVIDTGFAGNVHTDFAVFRQALDCGIVPDVVSTDITKLSAFIRGGRYGMTMCMSMAKCCGMKEEDILRSVTSTPAKVLGKAAEWGSLRVGGPADIAVFEETNEGFDLTDRAGNRLESKTGYRCVFTVSDGQIVYRD